MNLDEAVTLIAKHVVDVIDSCPHCGAKAHIVKQWSGHHTLRSGDVEFYVIFRCKPCKRLLLKTYYFQENQYHKGVYASKGWDEKYPLSLDEDLSRQDIEYIPGQVLSDYVEALKCESIGATKASCSMFRRALQSALMELGADDSKHLIAQINTLKNLPEDIKDWAHQIRIFGNWGAHPDRDGLKDVNKDDVGEVHDFTSKFLTFMFIMPRKVEASRKKREERLNKADQDADSD
jgi:hypothetical protein